MPKNKLQRVLQIGAMHLSSIINVALIFVDFMECSNSVFPTRTTVDTMVNTLIVVFSTVRFEK